MITRYDIGRSLANLRAALEATGFFASMAYNDDSNPIILMCYDADGNMIFRVSYDTGLTSPSFTWRAFKSGGSYIELSSAATSDTSYGTPTYLYMIGTDTAVIHFATSASRAAFIIIGKTTTGTIGFVMPGSLLNSTAGPECCNLQIASWDDDNAMTAYLYVSNAQSPSVGNSSLLVPIPMHGKYNEPISMTEAFFLPIAQNGMRSVVQEITDPDGNTYLTNGQVAIRDNVGGDGS